MRRRLPVGARLVVFLVIVITIAWRPAEARAQTNATVNLGITDLEVDGTGTTGVAQLMNQWATSLYSAPVKLNLSYVGGSDRSGRTAVASGKTPFAVSGRPLNADDLSRLSSRNASVVEAPLSVGSAALLYAPPYPLGLRVFTPDPVDPEGQGTFTTITDPIKIPNKLLVQQLVGADFTLWSQPDFVKLFNLPAGQQLSPGPGRVVTIARGDAGATSYYTQVLLHSLDPSGYNVRLAGNHVPADTIDEFWPFLDMQTRSGDSGVSAQMGTWLQPGGGIASSGLITLVEPSEALDQINQQKGKPNGGTPLQMLPFQNGAGEWSMPTPDTISKAAAEGVKASADGNGTPLYGLKENVPGAYPFTWINDIIVPKTGLSPEVTDAIATFLRYATGTGQDLAAGIGEGALPASLRAKAAAAADDIVKGNCAAAAGTLVTDGTGGPFWPSGVAVPNGGTLLCQPRAATPTTTTPTSNSGPGSVVGASGSSVPLLPAAASTPSLGSSAAPVRPTVSASGTYAPAESSGSGVPVEVAGGSTTAKAAPSSASDSATTQLASSVLPMKPPSDGQFSLDLFATTVLGGLSFVFVRRLARRFTGVGA